MSALARTAPALFFLTWLPRKNARAAGERFNQLAAAKEVGRIAPAAGGIANVTRHRSKQTTILRALSDRQQQFQP